MKFLDVSSPYFFANSKLSFIATLYGISLYFISYIASFNKLKSIFEILSIFQSAFRFFSINPCISILFSFIPNIASFIYSFASSSSISLHCIYNSICSSGLEICNLLVEELDKQNIKQKQLIKK